MHQGCKDLLEEVPGTIVKRGKNALTNNNVVEEQDGNMMREWAENFQYP